MMLYRSKLFDDATRKQEEALIVSMDFPEHLLDAMALADHFEKIQAEEYVIPDTGCFRQTSSPWLKTECYTAL